MIIMPSSQGDKISYLILQEMQLPASITSQKKKKKEEKTQTLNILRTTTVVMTIYSMLSFIFMFRKVNEDTKMQHFHRSTK